MESFCFLDYLQYFISLLFQSNFDKSLMYVSIVKAVSDKSIVTVFLSICFNGSTELKWSGANIVA